MISGNVAQDGGMTIEKKKCLISRKICTKEYIYTRDFFKQNSAQSRNERCKRRCADKNVKYTTKLVQAVDGDIDKLLLADVQCAG